MTVLPWWLSQTEAQAFGSSEVTFMHYHVAIRGALAVPGREPSDRYFCVHSRSEHLGSVSLGAMRGGREGAVAIKRQ